MCFGETKDHNPSRSSDTESIDTTCLSEPPCHRLAEPMSLGSPNRLRRSGAWNVVGPESRTIIHLFISVLAGHLRHKTVATAHFGIAFDPPTPTPPQNPPCDNRPSSQRDRFYHDQNDVNSERGRTTTVRLKRPTRNE